MIIDAAELERRYLQRIAGVCDKRVYIGPEVVALNIGNSCNLSCRFCRNHAPGNPVRLNRPDFLPLEKFIEILTDCVNLNVDQVDIVAAGEPTMHPAFQDMMRYLEHQPVFVKLFTNATFPLEYCSDVIRGDHVIINLSAVDRQQYRDLHGKDLFDRVVTNIKRLVVLRDTIKPEFYVEITYVANTMNVNHVQQIKALASQLGVNFLHLKKMNVHAYNRDIALLENPMSDMGGEDRRTPPECLNGWFYVTIKPDGIASICCRIYQMYLDGFDKRPFRELWRSSHMMNVRLLGKYGQIQKIYKVCETCVDYKRNIKWIQDTIKLRKNDKAVT